MPIPTEPIGSIPRPPDFLAAIQAHAAGKMFEEQFCAAEEVAVRETIRRLEETGSLVLTDGEQTKLRFATSHRWSNPSFRPSSHCTCVESPRITLAMTSRAARRDSRLDSVYLARATSGFSRCRVS